jgi:hypothetical protein
MDPQDRRTASFRAHFLAPSKNFGGMLIPTFYFNIAVIWFFTIMAYILLYYNGLSKLLVFMGRVPAFVKKYIPKSNK